MEIELPVDHLSNAALLEATVRLAHEARTATARLILALAELETRKAYLDAGYSSLHAYCTRKLLLSDDEACGRITAVHVGRKFPAVLEGLAEGALTLTNVGLLAPYLTDENHVELLSNARYKTKREVQEQVAELVDSPPLHELRIHVPVETLRKLDRVRDLLGHAVPDGDLTEIFDRALNALLAQLEKQKMGATEGRRADGATDDLSRYIPRSIRRKVWNRDGGRCVFIGTEGQCTETRWLQFHHRVPYAAGGATSVANLELRCRAHNLREAEAHFGRSTASVVREESTPYGDGPLLQESSRLQIGWEGVLDLAPILPRCEHQRRKRRGRRDGLDTPGGVE